MSARELIKALQDLGEYNLDREIIMFDGPCYATPTTVEVLKENYWDKKHVGKILID